MLRELQRIPRREERPSIYHLDVAAMYPNIILTNRLQPPAMVTQQTCASCDFYHPDMKCRREMEWQWRGELFPASRSEVRQIEGQLKHNSENFEASAEDIRKRVKDYSQKVYKRTHDTVTEIRTAYICQRENSFYVDTVLAFRDRRYEYKGLTKKWGSKLKEAEASGNMAAVKECKSFVVLYESLQLAHKCILNSFYGYVMRRGARWYSMSLAGVVTHKGGQIIRVARQLVERIGIPLELDTDGIWCCLPKSFPDNIEFKMKGEKKPFVVSYPCSMLNAQTHHDCINDQYHTFDEKTNQYKIHSECSILFELDGPYKAMVLPAAKEEGKRLKKRYAVFNFDGSLAELKGFELKRRGELQLVKNFQSEVFKRFLDGSTLDECYRSVANVANHWLDVLDNKGMDLDDEELIDNISESSNMSKTMEDYGDRKSMAITTAKRISEFLGSDMIKDKGLSCKYIVSRMPEGTPVTERAIPVEIFKAEERIQTAFLRKWCNCSGLVDSSVDVRSVLDWQYYKDRLASSIQKIVTIPAAMQLVPNPVERVPHPEWLLKTVRERCDPFKQNKIDSFFTAQPLVHPQMPLANLGNVASTRADSIMDIEGTAPRQGPSRPTVIRHNNKGANKGRTGIPSPSMEQDPPPLDADSSVVQLVPSVVASGSTLYTNFEPWHAHMTVLWKNKLNQRKRRRAEDIDDGPNRPKAKRQNMNILSGFYQSRHHSMLNRHWEVLSIVETRNPGVFRVWAILEDGSQQSLNLAVPRTIYLNYREATGLKPGVTLARKMPFGKALHHLVEEKLEESDFQNGLKDEGFGNDESLCEGIYESQVPLHFRAIMDMGCVCSVNRRPGGFREKVRAGQRPDVINLEDLKFESTTACPYLPARKVVRKVFIYYSFSEEDAAKSSSAVRGLLGVFAPMDEFRCQVWMISRFAQGQKPPLQRFLKEARQQNSGDDQGPEVQFEVNMAQSPEAAWRGAAELLKQYQEANPGAPTVVLKQSIRTAQQIADEWMPLLNDFPVLDVPAYPEEFDPLGWETKAGRMFISNYVDVDKYYDHVLQYARYAHIPICNIPGGEAHDMATTVSDVLFGRMLKNHQYLLWASPSSQPDLGGHDPVFAFECDELTNPDLCTSSASRNVCVTFDINNLPLTAIIHAKELEESVSSVAGSEDTVAEIINQNVARGLIPLASTLVDETTFCADPFKIVAFMAENWANDAIKNSNPFADSLQMNLYRWINNRNSLFFTPAMQRHVHKIVCKTFGILVGKLRQLGTDVFQAGLHTLVLSTRKLSLDQARGHCDYLIRAIREVPCMKYLELDPVHFWQRLVFMDKYNFAGLQLMQQRGDTSSSQRDQGILSGGDSVVPSPFDGIQVRMQWDIAEHLPRKWKLLFFELVSEFLCKPMAFRTKQLEQGTNEVPEGDDDDVNPGATSQVRLRLYAASFFMNLI
jgi:DNA polymerase epsilon subunit 1